jgi:hypothetical protein
MRRAFGLACALVAIVAVDSLYAQSRGIWVDRSLIASLPTQGPAWNDLIQAARGGCGTPALDNQDDGANVCIMAKALALRSHRGHASRERRAGRVAEHRAGSSVSWSRAITGRELAAYVIAADVIGLQALDPNLDSRFRVKIKQLLTTPTSDGPSILIGRGTVRLEVPKRYHRGSWPL